MCEFTVVVPVYNEGRRLAEFLRSIPSEIPILLLDKGSNDESVLIAKTFNNVEILDIPFGPPGSEFIYLTKIKSRLRTEWCLVLVVSQIVDLQLYSKINKVLTNNRNDIIELPFRNYTFGMCEAYNPWPSHTYKPLLSRVKAINFQPRVHQELIYNSTKVQKLDAEFGYVHHNSNTSLEGFLAKSIQYAKQEAEEYKRLSEQHPGALRPIRYVAKSLFNGFIRRKFTIFRGERGVLLGTAFVLTQFLILLFVIYGAQSDEKS